MSVLPLLTSWCSLVTVIKVQSKVSISVTNSNNLFNDGVIQSNSLVEAIEYELSLHSYYCS